MKNTRFAWFLGIYTALMLCSPSFATDFALNPARDFGAIRRINPTDYDGYAVVRENGAGLSSSTAAAFRAALEVFSKAEAEPAGAVATHAGLTATHGATGAVVGTTNTQALTNKTLTDASNHISGSVIDSGTVADANIASTIARDSELASAMSAANASDALNLRLNGSREMTGNLKFSGNYGILQSTDDGADNASILFGAGGNSWHDRGAFIAFYGNEHASNAGIAKYYTGNVTSGDHVFYTGPGTERFRIGYNGTIVAGGTLKFSTNAFIGRNTSDGSDNEFLTLCGGGGSGITRGGTIYVVGNEYSNQGGQIQIYAGGVETGHIIFKTGNVSERMRLTYGGNLLIGTTTDDGTNKLQVNGHAAAQSFRINNNEAYYCKDTGGTNRAIAFISSGDVTYLGHTSYPTRINSNGTLTHNGNTIWTSASDGAGSGLDADTVPNATPASAAAAGTAGSIRYDANYIYICVAANTWKRAAISTW